MHTEWAVGGLAVYQTDPVLNSMLMNCLVVVFFFRVLFGQPKKDPRKQTKSKSFSIEVKICISIMLIKIDLQVKSRHFFYVTLKN